MAPHKLSQKWQVRNYHPLCILASLVDDSSRFIYCCSLLVRLRETIQTLPICIEAVGSVCKVIATVHIIVQNFLLQDGFSLVLGNSALMTVPIIPRGNSGYIIVAHDQ